MTVGVVFYATEAEAEQVARDLGMFGFRSSVTRTEDADPEGARTWWEVTIRELPAELVATARVVESPPRTSSPNDTELDEWTQGTSRWDEQWERDQERRDYGQ